MHERKLYYGKQSFNVDDHEQPYPLDSEFVLKPKWITHDYFEPHIKAMPVKLHNLIRANRGPNEHGIACR